MNKTIAVLTAVLTLTAGSWTWAGTPKMKMTTQIPEGIETPNKLKTHLGTFGDRDTAQGPRPD